MVRVYEEYASPKEKRQAQRGARRGYATGKARGYLFVFNEDGKDRRGHFFAIGELFDGSEPGESPHCMTHCTPSTTFLRDNCRFVGFGSIPASWKRAFATRLDDAVRGYDGPERKQYTKRYARYLKYSGRTRARE